MVKKPWEQYNGEETQRKQTGDAQEVSSPPTGSASETQQDESWDKAPTMQPVDVVAAKPEEKGFTVKESMYNKVGPKTGFLPSALDIAAAKALGTASAKTDVKTDGETPATEQHTEVTEGNSVQEEKGGSSNVKPLDVGTVTPAISGDPNETEEQKQARAEKRSLENYAQEHPWVLEKDYSTMRNKYRDKKWSEIVNEVAAYREKTGNPMSYEEKMYMLSQYNPDTSKKEEVREKRLAYWADALNQLGNVLAHFYNYGRAKGGSPAAQIPDNKSSYSERLRAADMAMRQRGYNDYVNALANAQKRKQTREDMEYRLRMQEAQEQRRLANQMELKRMEWMSPKYKKELERLDIDLQDKQVQKELHELQKAFQMMKNDTAKDHAFEMFVRKNNGNRSGGGNGRSGNKFTYSYDIDGKTYEETDEYNAYTRAMAANHPNERVKKKGKVTREDLIKAGVRFPGSGK